ncbi:MerR family transcriptional regulator, copper efflux regulator [Amphritea atlantica]|uniref:MerR family transcriptional regulator, copper efflux regulator n=1 Tax=Amphritea atlantica TaxID=355243 RepID=A0A1H9EBL2_9GAMM|nr:Cu(I)-responsive transcriptional regulator [Amphritea atlantica]SEQ23100.1 MerR family transcriptional regulator, copper efflux regulator [Amphritea atlantica]
MNISQAAAATGLTSKTIRFYEQQGVIPPAARSANGYRIYSEQQLESLRFIKRARDLGFSLDESRELLQLSQDPSRTSASVKQKAELQIQRIDQQIESLQQMRAILESAARECRGDDGAECPILDQLNGVTVDNESPE